MGRGGDEREPGTKTKKLDFSNGFAKFSQNFKNYVCHYVFSSFGVRGPVGEFVSSALTM